MSRYGVELVPTGSMRPGAGAWLAAPGQPELSVVSARQAAGPARAPVVAWASPAKRTDWDTALSATDKGCHAGRSATGHTAHNKVILYTYRYYMTNDVFCGHHHRDVTRWRWSDWYKCNYVAGIMSLPVVITWMNNSFVSRLRLIWMKRDTNANSTWCALLIDRPTDVSLLRHMSFHPTYQTRYGLKFLILKKKNIAICYQQRKIHLAISC